MLTVDTILDHAESLLGSRALPYVLAGVLVIIWWACSTVVGFMSRGQTGAQDRPRRRLPL
jgi:hypothetical protein